MEATTRQTKRVEVRGGAVEVASGVAIPPWLDVGSDAHVIGRHEGCAMILPDKLVSGMHLELRATERGLLARDLGSRNGTYLGAHRIESILLLSPETLRCGDTLLDVRPGKPERLALSRTARFGRLVGDSPRMRALFEQLHRIAPTNVSVLIQGETGTGKELVAEALHEASDRAQKPFVVIDCTNIPAPLAESTLFGHEKGAFTGANSKRISPFVEARGGTVFLDEIGDLPVELQPKLLRALEQRKIQPVGSNRYEPVDVRVLAATHHDLARNASEGRFREDLYFRVARISVRIAPLRERIQDIPVLVRHMMEGLGKPTAFGRISEEAFERLERHSWPGNVRELFNRVEVALALDRGGPIDLAGPPNERSSQGQTSSTARSSRSGAPAQLPSLSQPHPAWLEEVNRIYFQALYDELGGNVSEMARESHVHRDTVRTYLQRFGIGKYRRTKRRD